VSKNLIIATALAVVAVSGGQTQAATYIKTQSGYVWPKHECTSTPCVDCTFLTYEACYAKAKQPGLTDERPIGFGPDQRVPLRIDPLRTDPRNPRVPLVLQNELPLERECDRSTGKNNTTSYLLPGKGQIICPVPGAVEIAATPALRANHEPAPSLSAPTRRPTTGVEPPEFVIGSVVSFATPAMSCPNIDDAIQADRYDAAMLAARDCRNLDPSVREWVVVSTGSSRALPSRVLTETYGCVVPKTRWDQTQIAKRSSGIFGGYEMSRVLDEECRHVVRKMS
jgi:hypothetical protein